MATLFDKYNEEAFKSGITPKSKESIIWFQRKVDEITSVNRRLMMREQERSATPILGSMFMFFYDPKLKRKLPYYDRFPLVIIVDKAPQGFVGLNLHYLPNDLRARFLDGLLDLTNNDKFDATTKFNLTYNYLKSTRKYRYYKPCFKRYLSNHIQGNIAMISPEDWMIATFLPSESFAKKPKEFVHSESRKKIR